MIFLFPLTFVSLVFFLCYCYEKQTNRMIKADYNAWVSIQAKHYSQMKEFQSKF